MNAPKTEVEARVQWLDEVITAIRLPNQIMKLGAQRI